MKSLSFFLLPLYCLSVLSAPPIEHSPADEDSGEQTPTRKLSETLSPFERLAQLITGRIGDANGEFIFRDVKMTDQLLKELTIKLDDTEDEEGLFHGDEIDPLGFLTYTIRLAEGDLTIEKGNGHGVHRFSKEQVENPEFTKIFADVVEKYAVDVLVRGLAPKGLYLKPGAFNKIMAYLEKVLQHSDAELTDLALIVNWRLGSGEDAKNFIARDMNKHGEIPKFLSPRDVYNLIAHTEATASEFYTERFARKTLRRRSTINKLDDSESSSSTMNQITAEDIEDILAYFFTLQANATAALMPFIDDLISSNNIYLESLALPLYGMVNPSVFISSPFGPGPLAAADFDSFNDIQSALKSSGNYSINQQEYAASTHQYMRSAFQSVWKNATAVVNSTGSLLEMKNIMIFLAVIEINHPNSTDLFPVNYFTVQPDADVGSIVERTNLTSTPPA